jgi:hypothetical protein
LSCPGIAIPGPNVVCLQSLGIHKVDIFRRSEKLVLMSPTGHGVTDWFSGFSGTSVVSVSDLVFQVVNGS